MRLLLLTAWVVLSSSGCKSAQQKCTEARAATDSAWTGYVGLLEGEQAKAKALILENQRALQTLDARIGELAKTASDKLYAPGSDAWLRGYHVAFNDQCTKDPRCSSLKQGIAEAKAAIEDLEERVTLARAATAAMVGDLAQAKAASAACILDVTRPGLKAAQATMLELEERCADLPPPAPDPDAPAP